MCHLSKTTTTTIETFLREINREVEQSPPTKKELKGNIVRRNEGKNRIQLATRMTA